MKPLRVSIVEQRQLHFFHLANAQVKLPRTYKKSKAQTIFPNLYIVAGVAITLLIFKELAYHAGKYLAGY